MQAAHLSQPEKFLNAVGAASALGEENGSYN